MPKENALFQGRFALEGYFDFKRDLTY
jgi:hypothetical protein